jgi:hypothetical protein
MSKVLLYDNSDFVPQDISHLLGVNRFSDIYYRKRSLDRWMADICAAAGIQFIEIGSDRSSREAARQAALLSGKNLVALYMPAYIAFGCSEEDAALFLKKLAYTRTSLSVCAEPERFGFERLQAAATVGDLALGLVAAVAGGESVSDFLAESAGRLVPVTGDVEMIDMRDPLHFTDYLTSNFDVRFFNSVQTENEFVLVKRSSDADKLRREYRYYGLLPPALQMFFIQPFDFEMAEGGASYRMERLFVPDMALQWIHGSLDELSLSRFLDKVFYYLSVRPTRDVGLEKARAAHRDAYRDKVLTRLEQLKGKAEYAKLQPYLDANFGGIDALFGRYLRLLERQGERGIRRELCIGHGDLCFSNILYSKTTGLMRFIDPRGADSEDGLYVDLHYDLAKLSHSIVGNYDFINYGLYRLEIGADLQLDLEIHPGAPSWARTMFEQRLRDAGHDPALMRLLEASLFLSMVPLHIDAPKKVLAFLVNAGRILSELERAH